MGGGAGALNDESIYTHTYTHTHSLSLSLPLPPPPPYTHTSITGYWDGKRCVFRANLKANVELERRNKSRLLETVLHVMTEKGPYVVIWPWSARLGSFQATAGSQDSDLCQKAIE